VKLTKRDRKVILIGGSVFLVVMVVYFGILPLIDLVGQIQNDKVQREEQLVRMAESIRQKEYLQQALGHLKSSEDSLRALLLEGDDPTVVTSELHRLVTTMAEQQGIAVTRVDASSNQGAGVLEMHAGQAGADAGGPGEPAQVPGGGAAGDPGLERPAGQGDQSGHHRGHLCL
jgi:type II secretory pathway component PulM